MNIYWYIYIYVFICICMLTIRDIFLLIQSKIFLLIHFKSDSFRTGSSLYWSNHIIISNIFATLRNVSRRKDARLLSIQVCIASEGRGQRGGAFQTSLRSRRNPCREMSNAAARINLPGVICEAGNFRAPVEPEFRHSSLQLQTV